MAAMPDRLEAAVQRWHAAQDAVPEAREAAQKLVNDARDRVEQARLRLADAIVEAARGGMRQRDLVAATGYNRESIRRILRAGGIEADE
jgi:ElaB/YqjD/DUF883 family membrane-anchored ribosome-binding protein